MLTLGDKDAAEQLRSALAVGCHQATHVVADAHTLGPADVAREIAAVVQDHEAAGRTHDLVLLGSDAADSGDFQVGIRLAYELGRPVVNGATTVTIEEPDGSTVAIGKGPEGQETYRVPLPAVITIREGGVEPRYPSVEGPDGGQEGPDRGAHARRRAARTAAGQAAAPATDPELRADPGRGPGGRARGRRPLRAAGGAVPMILVHIETDLDGTASEVSLEAITFARNLSAEGGGVPVDAVVFNDLSDDLHKELAAYGVRTVHRVGGDDVAAYSGAGWASAILTVREAARSVVVMAAGTDRGMELMAHVGARAGVAMAANVISFSGLAPFVVTRQVAGGAAREEMVLNQRPAVFTVAGHALEAAPATESGPADVVEHTPDDRRGRPGRARRVFRGARGGPVRGARRPPAWSSAPAAASVAPTSSTTSLELTSLLGATLGVSRVVTSAGWRPHHEQVGQTGSRISPELYIPCGISGAIQHWAGCASAKNILAINSDAEAPMVTKATYAVIGDLHEIVPAINEEINRRRG